MAVRMTLPSTQLVIEKPPVDMSLLREYRLGRIRQQLEASNFPFCVLVSPLSIRYAVDNREYQGFQSRLPTQYLFVPADGPVVQFGGTHRDYPAVDDYRPFGYCADISRTWLCGDAEPSEQQRTVYRIAHDEIQHNIGLLKAGVSFEEFSRNAFPKPAEYVARRYPCVAHGVGMSDEYPKIAYTQDWDDWGYDGVFEENMTICIESFTGSDKGGEGVKLEQMVLVTESGCEPISTFPFETQLLESAVDGP